MSFCISLGNPIPMRKTRKSPSINAGSMADIAFLLLIFFLTTTSIYNDKGIIITLPEYYEGPVGQVNERNVAVIRINGDNEVLFEKKQIQVSMIKEALVEFITNPNRLPNLPASPTKAIVSIQNDPNISYQVYMDTYSEIKAAYRQIHHEYAKSKFGKTFESLSIKDQNAIKELIPIKISEAEYTNL